MLPFTPTLALTRPAGCVLCCAVRVLPCLQVEVAAAHRGRLSLLVNLLGKPLGALCTEMEGKQSDFRVGDVKYHLGELAMPALAELCCRCSEGAL